MRVDNEVTVDRFEFEAGGWLDKARTTSRRTTRQDFPWNAMDSRSQGLPDVQVYRGGHDAQWCVQAQHATAALLALAGGWGAAPRDVDFRTGELPIPDPGDARRPARLTGDG